MKSLQKFVIITLLPLFIIAVSSIILSPSAFEDIKNIKIVLYLFFLFSILSFIYVYVLETKYLKSKHLFKKMLIASMFVFFIVLIFSFIFQKLVFDRTNFLTPFFQAILAVCIFLLEYLVTEFYLKFSRKASLSFTDNASFYIKTILSICIIEYILFCLMMIDILQQTKSFYWFYSITFPLLIKLLMINFSAFLSLKYLNNFNFFKTKPLLMTILSVLVTLVCTNVIDIVFFTFILNKNLLYSLLVVFSCLLFFSIVNYRDELNNSKGTIKSLTSFISRKELQYLRLKNQVNPHFLFNNLNTLISFIEVNPQKAIDFGHHLSNTYRHYLKSEDDDFVLLHDELLFITDYLEIFKAKFTNGFEYSIEALPTENDYILSLSLQEIIDNIFKHNILDDEKPMKILVSINNDYLQISNSLHKKITIKSDKYGLENIKKRYTLLTNKSIEYLHEDDNFTVRIPIFKLLQ